MKKKAEKKVQASNVQTEEKAQKVPKEKKEAKAEKAKEALKEKKASKKFDLDNLPQKEIEKCGTDLSQSIWPFLASFFEKRYGTADFLAYPDLLISLIQAFSFFLAYFKGQEILFNIDYGIIRTYFENPDAIDGFLSAAKDCEDWVKDDEKLDEETRKDIIRRINSIRDIASALPVYDDEKEMKDLLAQK